MVGCECLGGVRGGRAALGLGAAALVVLAAAVVGAGEQAAAVRDGGAAAGRELVHAVLPVGLGLEPAAVTAVVEGGDAASAAVPDFAIAVPGGAMTTAQLASAATVVRTTISGGFSGAIVLSVTGLPAGVGAVLAPGTIGAPGAGAATLTLAAGAGAPVGGYTVTVKGTSGATIRTVTVSFTIAPYAPTPVTVYTDGFEGTFPGVWHTRRIGANTWWGSSTHREYAGAKSVYCAASGPAAAPAGGPYPANMSGWMAYGPFSLVGATAAQATFKYWNKSQLTNDTFQFMVSIDGLHFWGFKRSGTASSAWQSGEFDFDDDLLPNSAIGQPAVYFAFIFESDGSVQYEGAYVDDLTITKTVGGTPCVVGCTAAVPAWAAPGAPVQLEGTLNAASCGGSPAITWSFGDGTPQSTAPSPVHTWAGAGVYPWQMTAAMGGQSCVKNGSITISEPATCSLSCSATVPEAWSTRSPVPFHATAIATDCGAAPAFSWDFGDGASASTADTAHGYATLGPRNWTLTVTAGTETCVQSGTVTIRHSVRRRLALPH